ncbi:MAG: polyketide synthase dehydratase domain-containing protein, partial [Pirellulales bacterium]|nr:polyketide synthase dehydratase domain-containing protein [Pirellulales bacterium]
EPRDARVHAEMTDAGVVCRLTSDFRNRRGQLVQKDRPHFSAVVDLVTSDQSPHGADAPSPMPAMRGEWHAIDYPSRDGLLYHGPPLRLLKQIAVEGNQAWGQIELPAENELAGDRDARGWLTPSAAIDACYYACGIYTWVCGDEGVTVPESLGELRFGRPGRPGEQCVAYVTCRELAEQLGTFDFVLVGDDRSVIFEAKAYRCHVLRGGTR